MSTNHLAAVRQSVLAATFSMGVTYFFHVVGLLPYLERQFYDIALRVRPASSPATNIVIVGLTEKDIEKLGYPVTDEVLANLINFIDQQNPRVIGLDLHRNVNIGERNNKKLDEIFSENEKLIGVEKTNGGNDERISIPPPIQLELAKRTGASEIIEDVDNIVRRAYLYTQKVEKETEKKTSVTAFGLAVALKYLEADKIFSEGSTKGWLKLKEAVFSPIKRADFFYSKKELDNYQILINYPDRKQPFKIVTFSDIIEGNVASSLMQDKIVLIGLTAETVGDIYYTPYPTRNLGRFVYGVELHGVIANQIITAANNSSKIISFPTSFLQYLWLLIWLFFVSFVSGKFCLSGSAKKPEIIWTINWFLSSIIVIISGYGGLLAGWVIPTVTTLSLLFWSQLVTYIYIRFNKLSQDKILLKQQVQEKTQALMQAQAIILKQEKLQVHQLTAYNVAHEINNKINSIQLQLENSQDDLTKLKLFIKNNSFLFEEDETRSTPTLVNGLDHKICEIYRINEEVIQIIDDIYQRQGKNYQLKKAININHILRKILKELVELNQQKLNYLELQINQYYDKNIPKITCIAPQIERAFEKLIENGIYQVIQKCNDNQALDYQPLITITTILQANSVLIKIKDNGMGIKAENMNQIFEPFWTTKSSGEGMGLGLYMAKEIIEEHGGTIQVDSEPGEWAEFIVTLPLNLDRIL